jgi:aminoglycoside phosphotransferase
VYHPPHTIPAALQPLVAEATWEQMTIGRSGDRVFRLTWPDRPTHYLKIASPLTSAELRREHDRLLWLRDRLPAPEVRGWAESEEHCYLLLSAIPGVMTCDEMWASDAPRAVRALAEGLRMLHSADIAACPFDESLDLKLAQARQRMLAGLVDEEDFDEIRLGRRAEDLFAELLRTRPTREDLVLTHGDYCLPNVFLDPGDGRVTGFIDWGRAGIADRYQDLALAVRSLAYNFGPGWEPLLWEAYGIAEPDRAKIEFYQLLDEFF